MSDTAESLHFHGAELQRLRRLDEARACYERAVALDPRRHAAFDGLASVLRAQGLLDAAETAERRAIALAPRHIPYYRGLVQSARLAADDPCLIALEQLARETATLEPAHQVELHFALGQALGALGDNARGFAHTIEGNRLQRRRIGYDEAATLGMLALAEATCPAEALAQDAGGDPSERPVFIVGMPRSGSTLIEQILASHPDAAAIGERSDFTASLAALFGEASESAPDLAALTAAQRRTIGAGYLRRIAEAPGVAGEARIVDKYPFNFAALGLIYQALPRARIIHSRRAPVDTCLSCFAQLFQDVPFSYDLAELGRYYRAYDALMAHWRKVLPPGVMLEIDYAALVTDFEPQVRRLLAHCGLDWNPACLAFHETARPVVTASAAQVRQSLYRTALHRWRPPPHQLQPLLDALGPDLAAGAYLAAPV